MILPTDPPPDVPVQPSRPTVDKSTFLKRLARVKKSILRTLGHRERTSQEYRRASTALRRAGDLPAAELQCATGIALYPKDLELAIEHAKIATAAKDRSLRQVRWQRVFDLGGERAPANAFGELLAYHRDDPSTTEALLRKGLALHPTDFSLLCKFGNLLATQDLTAAAIDAWGAAIAAHPKKNLAPIYFRLAHALRNEGLLVRAEVILREGAERYPEDALLHESLSNLSYLLAAPSRKPVPCNPIHRSTAHLFRDHYHPNTTGTLAFSPGSTAVRQHVSAMLDFAEVIPAPTEGQAPGATDAFAVWGPPSNSHLPARETAAAAGRPLLCIDSGFLSSPSIEGKDFPAYSIIVTPETVYYDTTRPSPPETQLNSDTFTLTDDQYKRSETCIALIVKERLSKFNHAPRIDLHPRFPADGTHRILLIDQRKKGSSIHWSLGAQATFERMWEDALALPACQILVKIHPEAIAGRDRSYLAALIPHPLPGNVVIIDFDVNPHDLLDVVDEVFVCTSQMGLEAVMAGKKVHCFAAPYYAGWGFTQDRGVIPRRGKRRTPAEVFHLYHITHSRYFVPEQGVAEIEDLIQYLAAVKDHPVSEVVITTPADGPLKILMVIPSGRYGATGRYLQNLSVALVGLGCEVMVLVKGPCKSPDSGVRWLSIEFDGLRLTASVRREIVAFAPHFVYENGVRARSQRAALEAVALTGARFAMQSMDDDVQIQRQREGNQAAERLVALDRPELTTSEVASFLSDHDWNTSLRVFLDPDFNYWIEPLLRIVCHRLASFHTAIWHPYAARLAREYAVPTLVIPPVASNADFERLPMTTQERTTVLERYQIDPTSVVIFIGGALYSYSDEFTLFLTALNLAAEKSTKNFALVVTSARSSLPLARMAAEKLGPSVSFTDIGDATDAIYMEMLKACDVVCSPGLPDDFNRYRLPSRLVKAMAMAKPILTCRCGFGESLEHGVNAFLMDGEAPAEWAMSIALTQDISLRTAVGIRGQDFARENFDAHRVATALKQQFEISLTRPARTLAAGIATDTGKVLSGAPSIRLKGDSSPLRAVMQALALRTHRLDTIVHIGAGKCGELEDYCRLGASHITLVEPLPELAESPKQFKSHDGKIVVRQVAVAGNSGLRKAHVYRNPRPGSTDQEKLYLLEPTAVLAFHPSLQLIRTEYVETYTIADVCEGLLFTGLNDLLVVDLQGLEVEALRATPESLVRKFEWIAVRVSENPLFENGATQLVTVILQDFGFQCIPSTQSFSGAQISVLFRKQAIDAKETVLDCIVS